MIQLGTKAETLEAIRPRLTKAKICPSVVFTVTEWETQESVCLQRVKASFSGRIVIVRSSAMGEDSAATAMAGMHASVSDIPSDDAAALRKAVLQVVDSYAKTGVGHKDHNQILVQPMVTGVSMSGVVFTQDLNTGSPYYVINYDDETGKTDTVTSGTGDCNRTLLIHRGHLENLRSPRFKSLLMAVTEIEQMVPAAALDIEFAVTFNEEIYIFQVRPMAVQSNWDRSIPERLAVALEQISDFLDTRFLPISGALGKKSIFGEMSDWNPAEMIGSNPRRLASSLYQQLITNSTWAEARAEMGYRDMSGRSLMVSLGGRPYIDVRESFNSFLPAGLPDEIGEKLVDHWLGILERQPELHDKVEFEIATTIHSLDFDQRAAASALHDALTPQEIAAYKKALLGLTNEILSRNAALIEAQYQGLEEMSRRRARALAFRRAGNSPLALAKQLLTDCRTHGTKQFAILARCGFIAEEFLRSLVRSNLIAPELAADFRRSVTTVLSDFLDKVRDYQKGLLQEAELLAEYGHLRPGTYNILSQRYDERLAQFGEGAGSGGIEPGTESHTKNAFSLPKPVAEKIDDFLAKNGYQIDCARLFPFMRKSIEGRELAKLRFTQNLSDALELIAEWGSSISLSREEVSHISVQDILDTLTSTPMVPVTEHFRSLSRAAAGAYQVSLAIKLPYLITDTDDVHVVPLLKSRPNFITNRQVEASVLFMSGQAVTAGELNGKIVLIEGADPGYDWIFMSSIAGLITKFGGANSHMAIRCAELGIPAAIGCGEQIFDLALHARSVSLDCGAGQIIPTG